MAIAFRSNSTGSSSFATTSTISLPSGTTTGDVTILFAVQATSPNAGGSVPAVTAPAGWTVLLAFNGMIVCWRAWQSGDPSSGITFTSNVTQWWLSLGVSYSGCDTAAPIDTSNPCYNITGASVVANPLNIFRAPSVAPSFNSGVLLTLYGNGGSAGGTAIAVPAGTTSRATTSVGPSLLISEKTLTDGTPTGDIDTTRTANADLHFGMSVVLKTSGATAATLAAPRPTFGAIFNGNSNTGSYTLPLTHLNVRNGDLVLAFLSGAGTAAAAPAGWTQLSALQGANCFYRTWSTGDPTAPVFTWSGGSLPLGIDAVCLRRTAGAVDPIIDTSGTNSGSSTVATPSLTPAGSPELLLTYFGTRVATGGTWSSVTAGLSNIDINTAGPSLRFSSLMPSGSPTAVYSATFSLAGTIDALAVLVGFVSGAAGAAAQARAMILA